MRCRVQQKRGKALVAWLGQAEVPEPLRRGCRPHWLSAPRLNAAHVGQLLTRGTGARCRQGAVLGTGFSCHPSRQLCSGFSLSLLVSRQSSACESTGFPWLSPALAQPLSAPRSQHRAGPANTSLPPHRLPRGVSFPSPRFPLHLGTFCTSSRSSEHEEGGAR